MIQRIQTLYLLLVVILSTLLCFFSPVQFELIPYGILDLVVFDKWPLAIVNIAIPLLALVNIFLFKHRFLQVRLNIMNVILCIGYYAMLALYIAFIIKGNEPVGDVRLDGAKWYLTTWTCIPLVNIVLTMMATRRILKDEALVRAADRIR